MKKAIALGILSLTLATAASAQVKPEDQIKFPQAGYSFMSWNMGKIKANLEGEYNAQQVQAAATAIAGIAGSGMGALYGPGTEKVIELCGPGHSFAEAVMFMGMPYVVFPGNVGGEQALADVVDRLTAATR